MFRFRNKRGERTARARAARRTSHPARRPHAWDSFGRANAAAGRKRARSAAAARQAAWGPGSQTASFGLAVSLAALGACLLLLPRSALGSNGAAPIGFGAKATGRAGAGTAVADDAIAAALNPAVLTEIAQIRLDASVGILASRYRFKNLLNDELVQSYDTFIPAFGFSWDPTGEPVKPGPEAFERGGRFRLGFQLFAPLGGGGSQKFRTEVFPNGERESLSFFALGLGPSAALRALDWLSVGVGFHLYMVSVGMEGLVGTNANSSGMVFLYRDPAGNPILPPRPVIVEGQQATFADLFTQVGTSDTNQSSRLELSSATGLGFGGVIGLLATPLPNIAFGLSYRFEGRVPRLSGDCELDATQAVAAINNDPDFARFGGALFQAYLPNGGSHGFKADYDFELEDLRVPAVLSAGVAFWPHPRFLLALDLRWIRWSTAFSSQPVTLSNGSNEDINAINGADRLRDENLLDWDDQFVVAVGASVLVSEGVVVRAGYNYGNNPIPATTLTPTTGFLEHHVALGVGFYVGAFDIDLSYVYALPRTEAVDRSKVHPAFDGLSVRAEQHFVYLGGSFSF